MDDEQPSRGATLRTLNQAAGFVTLLLTGIAFAGWLLLGLDGVLPPVPGLVWTALTFGALLLAMPLIADERVSEAIKLIREIAALVLLVGLIRRLGQTESAPWTDLADLLRSIVAGA
jgi:hypothetical protein